MKQVISALFLHMHPALAACTVTVLVAAGVCGAVLVTKTVTEESDYQLGSDIVKQCNQVLQDGFGKVEVKTQLLIDQPIDGVKGNCVLELTDNAKLEFKNVTLSTGNIHIHSSEETKNTRVSIVNSTLTSPNGGLQISLKGADSAAKVSGSRLNYPLSIGIAVGHGDGDESAWLQVEDSQFVSQAAETEGIYLVSTGSAIFSRNNFTLYDEQDFALLLAPDCSESNNIGSNQNCQVQ